MATFSPPTTTTTRVAAVATSSTTLSSSPFFKRTLQLSAIGKHKHCFKVSCKALDGEKNPNVPSKNSQTSQGKFDRRDVLIGLGGLYGAAGLAADPLAFAAPLTAPDISKCGSADLPTGAKPTNCCPPRSTKVIDFKLPRPANTMRVRPAAHLANKEYIAKFNKAIQLMKDLPDSDPRSFTQQANVHCAYCDGAYSQVGFPDLDIQVHNSWIFFPWHRYYLYFFEKILGKLIDDPNFAIPYWNWDAPAGMTMPAIYTDPNSPLYDKLRDAKHQPPNLVDLDYNGRDENTPSQQQINSNLTIMYRQVVSSGRTPQLFLGSTYRAGDEPDPGAGSLENIPHGPVHIWCGDRTQPNLEDMGNFYSAARDPIFYAHHSNVDRMWSIWKTLGGRRQDFTDPDWLNAGFVFYDENADLVRVKVKDCVDTRKLGYVYQDVDIPWLTNKPTPRVANISGKTNNAGKAIAAETPMNADDVFPRKLDGVVKVMVPRPKKRRSKKQKEEEEEVLVIEGIEVPRDVFAKFDVFINDEDEATSGPDKTEFAGSFVNVPHKHKHHKKIKTRLRLGISELLEDLDAEDDEGVLVTLVPKYGSGDVIIGGVKIEFDS
ncbi:Polyphenol oxidase [Actinidia chinensis var. chinensis]|uniref:Polyphenol oxidase n=1 Tax=Actinidia chinensis var. chinensis TaxID=1590841 RepID=A0A2R6PXU1_ACTCC|nr:Polyphenol oxidase [Actinidia chinensis var. chinensis]